ncbi:MAG TPA: hypothetical protein PKB10_00025, partial [Tepidisphaeraceae bacterium]|nr:hypothetical protein [Tepidisphaeraceae bacterium]
MTWCRRTRARIGVDVGHHAVKAAQVSGDGRTLEAAVEIPLRQPGVFDEREADRLASTLRRKDFAEAPVCVIAPAKATLASVIELPPESPGVPVDMLASAEAARVHRLAPHSFELAYWR